MSRTNPLPRDFRSIVPEEVDEITIGRALRESVNDAITLREKLREATELDAVQSGKQERDQMRCELWGDE